MATIRSNLNSVSSTTHIKAAIKKRLTTCFKNWHKNSANQQLKQPKPPKQQTTHCTQQQQHYNSFCQQQQEYSFKEQTHNHLKHLRKIFKHLFSTKKKRAKKKLLRTKTTITTAASATTTSVQSEQLQFVAKLLSSTLIATTAEITQISDYEEILEDHHKQAFNMAIKDDLFITIRNEIPTLDAEVRGILAARAQEGATISEIKHDYLQFNGTEFPIEGERIAEFLITIPYVTATCTEQGTIIFNVLPSAKTKEVIEDVKNQKKPKHGAGHCNKNNNYHPELSQRAFYPEKQRQHRLGMQYQNYHNNIQNSQLARKEHVRPVINNTNKPYGNGVYNKQNNYNNAMAYAALEERVRASCETLMPMPIQSEPDRNYYSAVPTLAEQKQTLSTSQASSSGFVESNWDYEESLPAHTNNLKNAQYTRKLHSVNLVEKEKEIHWANKLTNVNVYGQDRSSSDLNASNWAYEDNCKHLSNRFCSPSQQLPIQHQQFQPQNSSNNNQLRQNSLAPDSYRNSNYCDYQPQQHYSQNNWNGDYFKQKQLSQRQQFAQPVQVESVREIPRETFQRNWTNNDNCYNPHQSSRVFGEDQRQQFATQDHQQFQQQSDCCITNNNQLKQRSLAEDANKNNSYCHPHEQQLDNHHNDHQQQIQRHQLPQNSQISQLSEHIDDNNNTNYAQNYRNAQTVAANDKENVIPLIDYSKANGDFNNNTALPPPVRTSLEKEQQELLCSWQESTSGFAESNLANEVNRKHLSNQFPNQFQQPLAQRQIAQPVQNRSSSDFTTSLYNRQFTATHDYEPKLLEIPLLGDDLFLYFARRNLKCKFMRFQKVYQSGLCVSGQTIKGAIERIRAWPTPLSERRVIINIGSVDLMRFKSVSAMQRDLDNLINVMEEKGLIPILTTLAPLVNYGYIPMLKLNLLKFNEFIRSKAPEYLVIDIWSTLATQSGKTLFGCYQNEPRYVTGAKEAYVFWNNVGRDKVQQLLESKI